MSRCPACGYALRELDGAPKEPASALERDVACPECGFLLPAGSRVVVGGISAYAMGGKGQFSMLFPYILVGCLGVFLWMPQVIRGVVAWSTGGPVDFWQTATAAGGLVFVWFTMRGAANIVRTRRSKAVADEVNDANELMIASRGYLFAPGWLVVFDRAARRKPAVVCIEGRAVRSVSVIEDAAKQDGVAREAAHEVSARLLPPGPTATVPVFVRATTETWVLASGLLSSLRAEPTVDLAAFLERWKATDGAGRLKVTVRRADAGAPAPTAGDGIDGSPDGVRVTGSPHLPAAVDPAAAGPFWSSAVFIGLLGGVGVGAGFFFSKGGFAGWFSVIPVVIGAIAVVSVVFAQHAGLARRYTARSEWRISRAGVVVEVDGRRTEIPAASIAAIELGATLGVPHFVLRGVADAKPLAVLVPDDWGGRAPEAVLVELRAALARN